MLTHLLFGCLKEKYSFNEGQKHNMKTLAVVISAFNEEKDRKDSGFCTFADEIIVVDNGSADATSKIARIYGAKIFKKNNRMLNVNKNYGLQRHTAIGYSVLMQMKRSRLN